MKSAQELISGKLNSLVEGFFWLLPNLVIATVALGLFFLASRLARRAVVGVFASRGRTDLGALLGGFVRWGVLGLGLLTVATIVFPSVKPSDALATLGIGSVAIGFAFKDILQNWFAGLLILLRQPFRRGDQIVVNSYEGTVEHIEARATLIRTYDGRRVVIPNSDVYTRSVIVNTAFPKRRTDYDVGIGYGDDIETARRVILEALARTEGVAADPKPDVIPWELDGSTVNLKVRWWTDSTRSSVVATRGRVIAAVKAALGEAGIDLPYPTQVVLFHDQTEATDGDRRRQREGWPAGEEPPRPRHLNEVRLEDARKDAADAPAREPARAGGFRRG
jgi:small-conductance mechanosensitive channel